jgi:hypothetical protein
MRFLLNLAFLVAATLLLAHGLMFEDDAHTELDKGTKAVLGPSRAVQMEVERKYPYCASGIRPRSMMLETDLAKGTVGSLPTTSDLKQRLEEVPKDTREGISSEPPYILPRSAAIIGLAGLLLALVLPRTKLRSLALLGLIAGLLAAGPSALLPREQELAFVSNWSFYRPVLEQFPRIAIACLYLAGFTLGIRSRPRVRAD